MMAVDGGNGIVNIRGEKIINNRRGMAMAGNQHGTRGDFEGSNDARSDLLNFEGSLAGQPALSPRPLLPSMSHNHSTGLSRPLPPCTPEEGRKWNRGPEKIFPIRIADLSRQGLSLLTA